MANSQRLRLRLAERMAMVGIVKLQRCPTPAPTHISVQADHQDAWQVSSNMTPSGMQALVPRTEATDLLLHPSSAAPVPNGEVQASSGSPKAL